MAEIAPFSGILYAPRPSADQSSRLAPPYDVISPDEREALARLDPHNIVRLILPQPPPGAASDERYAAAAKDLGAWLQQGVLQRDARPALYRYHQIFTPPGTSDSAPITRRGFIALCRLHHFTERIILPHERTLAGPKADRLKLKRATRCHLSQIFGMYSDPRRLVDEAFTASEARSPDLYGRTQDGVEHRLWRVTDAAAIEAARAALRDKRIYIADGHHRYETMLALREELRREPGYRGPSSIVEYGTFFLCNADDPGLVVFPTHRVLHSLAGFDVDALLRRAADRFQVEELPATPTTAAEVTATLARKGCEAPSFLLLSQGRAAYLTLRKDVDLSAHPALRGPAVLRQLDVSVLHALIIEDLCGVDRQAQEAMTNLRYIKDTAKALHAAADPANQALFLMNPTPVAQVMAVADAGEVMPQKSTYFYPKIASGIVLSPLDPAEPVATAAEATCSAT